jgi:hypothetical protein
MVKETMLQNEMPTALVEDITLEVPEEPDREDDDDLKMEANRGSLMNFLTGGFLICAKSAANLHSSDSTTSLVCVSIFCDENGEK